MRALVYHGPGQKAWEEVPDPEITDDGDVIVRVDATTICGTDLHILGGDVPEVTPGRILGHEAVGTVVEAGDGVHRLTPGDRVLVSCITACGACRFCRDRRYGQCLGSGGWILGHKIDGTQAEFVRVPFADTSTYQVPAGAAVGIINSRPCDAVNVVANAPFCSAPCSAPAAPASDCISTTSGTSPQRLGRLAAAQSSECSAIGDAGVIG